MVTAFLTGLTTTLGNAGAIAAPFPADQQLLAQRIVDGLPPPPPSAFPTAPVSAPAVSVPTAPTAPTPAAASAPLAGDRYLVVVNGDSPLLLDQVRRVESGAALQNLDGQQVIQAGVFDDRQVAQQQAQVLAAQGIGAEVIPVAPTAGPSASLPAAMPQTSMPQLVSAAPTSPLSSPDLMPLTVVPREVEFGRPADFDNTIAQVGTTSIAASSSYYVVIPGDSDEVNRIADQVIRLGSGIGIASVVDERRSPIGPHVLVGPYSGRSAAARWSRYFRDFGMDARVYYRR